MSEKKQPYLPAFWRGVALVLSVLALSLSVSYLVSAWAEPPYGGCAVPPCPLPPAGNAPAPINISSTAQTKTGNLAVNALGISGVGVNAGDPPVLWAPNGNVGFGTVANPVARLEIDMRTPTAEGLHISRDAAAAFSYLNIENELGNPIFKVHENGNVGIGTTNPTADLHIVPGEVHLESKTSGNYADIHFKNNYSVGPVNGREYVIGNYAPDMADPNIQNKFFIRDNTSSINRFIIDENGNIGIGTAMPNAKLDINSNSFILEQAQTPAASSSACTVGMHAWDANYIYVCVATDTWKRSALSTW